MHLAEVGYLRPRWVRAYLAVVVRHLFFWTSRLAHVGLVLQDKNNLVVKWFYGPHPYQHYDNYYERVKESSPKLTIEIPPPVAQSESAEGTDIKLPQRTKREVTESGFAFRLVYAPDIGQMRVEETDESSDEEENVNQHDIEEGREEERDESVGSK